jgi:hypothetical protein
MQGRDLKQQEGCSSSRRVPTPESNIISYKMLPEGVFSLVLINPMPEPRIQVPIIL